MIGCEDHGMVGGKLFEEDVELETYTLPVEEIRKVNDRSFTGNLPFMPIGHYMDPLFGEIQAIGVLRPVREWAMEPLEEGDRIRLRLNLDARQYGDRESFAEFELYRVTEPWRGNQFRMGDEISFDQSQVVGGFSIGESDSVVIELHPDWVAEYNEFLQMEGANQDSLDAVYRENFHGLAIVPISGDSKVLFSKMTPTGDGEINDTDFARFIIDNIEDEDEGRRYLQMMDWGAAQVRQAENQNGTGLPGTFTVFNTLESFLEIDLGLTREKFRGHNLANVEFVLFEDLESAQHSLPPGHTRPVVNQKRIHIIDESRQKAEFIFNRSPSFIAQRDTTDNGFRFNITSYANAVIYSTPPSGKLYVSSQSISGLIFSMLIHNDEASEIRRPKIVVTSIKDPEE